MICCCLRRGGQTSAASDQQTCVKIECLTVRFRSKFGLIDMFLFKRQFEVLLLVGRLKNMLVTSDHF